MAQHSGEQPLDTIKLFNATTGNVFIGLAKTVLGSVLLLASTYALFFRPFQLQSLGLFLAGAILVAIGVVDLRRSLDRSVKVTIDRDGMRDHRNGLAVPWSAVTSVEYNPKTTSASSAMLRLTLCPFASSGFLADELPAALAAWPCGTTSFSLEMTSLSYRSDQLLSDISRLGNVSARNILRDLPQ